jgi:hypothetical protein
VIEPETVSFFTLMIEESDIDPDSFLKSSLPLYEPTSEAGPRYGRRVPRELRRHGPGWRPMGTPERWPRPNDPWYDQWDTDALSVAKWLIRYLTTGKLKRPMYNASMVRAHALLGVYLWYDPLDKRLYWKVSKNWRDRLLKCGINPDTFEIANLNRWTRAWEYLKCEYRVWPDEIDQDILKGKPCPEYKPYTWSQSLRGQGIPYRPNPETLARQELANARGETEEDRKRRQRNTYLYGTQDDRPYARHVKSIPLFESLSPTKP